MPRVPAGGMSTATIYDVARMARVSGMTVSRVLNGKASVDDAIRKRVNTAIAALEYQVNHAARSARVGSLRIGLLFGDLGVPFMNDFLVGAMDQCRRHGAQLNREKCGGPASQRAAIARLIADAADCVLLPLPLCEMPAALRQLEEAGIPIVTVGSARPPAHIPAVGIDDYAAARAMMDYLFAAGHRDIAFIKGEPGQTPAELRYRAYLDAMDGAGMNARCKRVADGSSTYRSGLAAAQVLLVQPDRPSAIFACNDDMAAAVIAFAHGMGLRMPQDLAVCGFGNAPIAASVWPALTTIHQPVEAMARAAVQLAIESLREPMPARHRLLPYTLLTRESTAAPAPSAALGRKQQALSL
jgi:LacI family transcriptional regulator